MAAATASSAGLPNSSEAFLCQLHPFAAPSDKQVCQPDELQSEPYCQQQGLASNNNNDDQNSGSGSNNNNKDTTSSIGQLGNSILRRLVAQLTTKKKEQKLDNLEAMINDNALKLLQHKELLFKQNNCVQLDQLCRVTKFSRREIKWLYSGWKVACTDGCGASGDLFEGTESYGSHSLQSAYYGIINEHQFQQIYAQFFPYGGDCSYYAKYVFQAMFGETLATNGGFITFADYAQALSSLLRGSIEEKIGFVFRLYDLNNDNVLTLDELSRIFFAVYRLLGDNVNKRHDQITYEEAAAKLYQKINPDDTGGAITRDQFVAYCMSNQDIVDTIKMLEMSLSSPAEHSS